MRAPFVLVLSLLFTGSVSAKTVAFDFNAVSLVAFSQATFKTLLNRDYVISPEVLAMDRKITVAVRAVDERDVPAFIENLLLAQGIAVTEKSGVHYLTGARSGSSLSEPGQPVGPVDLVKALALPGAPVPAKGSARMAPVEEVPEVRREDDDSRVVVVHHRSAEFVGAVLVSAFGSRGVVVAGPSLVLTGSPGQLSKMSALVFALDAPPTMIDVAVSWIEVARTSGSARGVSLVANVLGARLGVSLGALNSGGALSLQGAKFQAVLDALDSDGRFKQVSNSRMVGDDREPMAMTVGDETPTVSSSGKDNQGNAIQNIVYRASGVIVNVLPKSLGNGKINLAVDGQISSFKATQTGVSGSPTLIKRQVKTAITVSPGEVILIGGLSDEQSTNADTGLGFLPASWKLKNKSSANTDLVLMLSAKLVANK